MKVNGWIVIWRHGGAYGLFKTAQDAADWAAEHSAMGWSIQPVYRPLKES